ncbi:MAG: S-formylglutathione hydrolase [Pseudomonadota bacterium]
METVSTWESHGGTQGVYRHDSTTTNCTMTFAVFVPPQAKNGPCPVLWYLSGLTCTHANVMEKGEYRKAAAEHGIIIVCPDTSPRGDAVADNADDYRLGKGAGFYLDATEAPWADHYQMASYVDGDLPMVVFDHFPADPSRQGIFGHSMGGHGALTLALKNPDRYKSCSAFAPIVNPTGADWSRAAFSQYLGDDEGAWRFFDACALIEDGSRFAEFLVDQGDADEFLETGLMPWRLQDACKTADIPLTLRMQPGYDHSYYFISSFMGDHIAWHAERLKG